MEEKVKLIGEIDFKDLKVPIYYDPSGLNTIAWQMRNPDSCYKGYILMSKDWQISYPEGAVIPEQTDRDREIMPKLIVTSKETIDDNFINEIIKDLNEGYEQRNS